MSISIEKIPLMRSIALYAMILMLIHLHDSLLPRKHSQFPPQGATLLRDLQITTNYTITWDNR